jgi:DNA modification methylase
MQRNHIVCADALVYMRTLPDDSVDLAVSSPPYYQLRDYFVEADAQIGLEPSFAEYLVHMVDVFREVRRVLKPTGTLWLNIGDCYAMPSKWGGSGGNHKNGYAKGSNRTQRRRRDYGGLGDKQLMGVPWRIAFALQADGWILRMDNIWSKTSVLPESVKDRTSRTHEYVFMFSKAERYYYDHVAVREPVSQTSIARELRGRSTKHKYTDGATGQDSHTLHQERAADSARAVWLTRNKRSVWSVAPARNKFNHFATFPPKLIEPMALAGSPPEVCAACGAPLVREVKKVVVDQREAHRFTANLRGKVDASNGRANTKRAYLAYETIGRKPTCACGAGTRPGVVLDPFMGSGTVALVAHQHRRDYVGCDINPDYVAIAQKRLTQGWSKAEVERVVQGASTPLFETDVMEQLRIPMGEED